MASNANPGYGGLALTEGSQGPDVALAQQWLNAARTRYAELPRVTVDGRFGADTRAAVRAYQRVVGLDADGAIGEDTWDSLYATWAVLEGEGELWPGVSLREGDAGATVRSAQQRLKVLVPSLAVDGRYGRRTRNAVFAYQVVHDLAPDGVLGQDTWRHLFA